MAKKQKLETTNKDVIIVYNKRIPFVNNELGEFMLKRLQKGKMHNSSPCVYLAYNAVISVCFEEVHLKTKH